MSYCFSGFVFRNCEHDLSCVFEKKETCGRMTCDF